MAQNGGIDRRAAIMRAGLTLFAERGFYGTRVPDIADRARVGAGTIYRYFATKEALVNAIFQEKKRAVGAVLDGAFDPGKPFEPQCLAVWTMLVAMVEADPVSFRFLEYHHHAAYLDATSREVASQAQRGPLDFLESAAAAGFVRQDLSPAELLSLVWGALVGFVRGAEERASMLKPERVEAAGRVVCRMLAPGARC
jgi:AcrR family transcriptional regulator